MFPVLARTRVWGWSRPGCEDASGRREPGGGSGGILSPCRRKLGEWDLRCGRGAPTSLDLYLCSAEPAGLSLGCTPLSFRLDCNQDVCVLS